MNEITIYIVGKFTLQKGLYKLVFSQASYLTLHIISQMIAIFEVGLHFLVSCTMVYLRCMSSHM